MFTFFRINAFELTTMLAGKWISKMFDPNKEQRKKISIESDRVSYEFTCEMHHQNFIQFIEKYFIKLCKEVKYSFITQGKVYTLFNFFSTILN